jgi:hypothetical protein
MNCSQSTPGPRSYRNSAQKYFPVPLNKKLSRIPQRNNVGWFDVGMRDDARITVGEYSRLKETASELENPQESMSDALCISVYVNEEIVLVFCHYGLVF